MKRYNDQTYIQAKSATESVGGELGVYTKAEIDDMISDIESGGADLTNYYTKSQVDALIDGVDPDLSNYYTKSQIDNKGYITSVPSEYITETELASYNFLTTHQDLSNYATQTWVNAQIANAEIGGGDGTIDLTNYVQFADTFNTNKNGVVPKPTTAHADYYLASNGTWVDIESKISQYAPDPDLSDYLTSDALDGYATESYVDDAISEISNPDLSGYAQTADLAEVAFSGSYNDLSDTPTIPDISDLVHVDSLQEDLEDLDAKIPTLTSQLTNDSGFITSSDLNDYVTQSELTAAFQEYDDSLNGMYTDQSQVSSMISSALSDYTTTDDLTSFIEEVLRDNHLI